MNKGETLEIKGLDYKLVCEQEEIEFPTYFYQYDVDDEEKAIIDAAIEEDKKDLDKKYLDKFFKENYEDCYPDGVPAFRDRNSYAIFKPDKNINHTYMVVLHNVGNGEPWKWDENISEQENKFLETLFEHQLKYDDFKRGLGWVFYHGENDNNFIFHDVFLNYIHSHLDKELTIVVDVPDSQINGVHILEGKTITTYDEYEKINNDIEYPDLDDITYFILTEEGSNKAEHLYKLGYMNDED